MRKKRSIWSWLLVAMILVGAAVWGFYTAKPHSDQAGKPGLKTAQEEKAVKPTEPMSKNDVDYRQQAQKVHQKLDQALAKAGGSFASLEQEEKRSKRDNGGAIIWHRRTIVIELPKDQSPAGAASRIKSVLAAPAGIVEEANDTWQGKAALRLDVGFTEQLGGEPLRLITDKVYLVGGGTAASTAKSAPKGQLAIIIDDCGYELGAAERMTGLPANLTFAILPYRPYSTQSLAFAQQRGKEAILHLPMEPLDASQASEAKMVAVSMTEGEIQQVTRQALDSLPGVIGVNNHQGSRATGDERTMRAVLGVVRSRGLYFIDSHTQARSVAYQTASEMGVSAALNGMFLDNSSDVDAIKNRMRQAAKTAAENGSLVAICHARPNTSIALAEVIGELQQTTNLVFASQLLR